MTMAFPTAYRIGIDLGGTKIEVAALAPDGSLRLRHRIPTPRGYDATLAAIADLVRGIETELGGRGSVGVGIPGVISPATGLVKNANSIALNGHPFDRDLAASARPRGAGRERRQLLRPVGGRRRRRRRPATACSGSSSAPAAAAASSSTGACCDGRHRIAGEWGHTPLPWPAAG